MQCRQCSREHPNLVSVLLSLLLLLLLLLVSTKRVGYFRGTFGRSATC